MNKLRRPVANLPDFEVCILAGGLSTRMGRDKARLKINGRTMRAHIRAIAAQAFDQDPPIRIRVIRADCVRRCGPLGGIVTGLRGTKACGVLFLACDMPLISPALLRRIVRASQNGKRAVLASHDKLIGFPLFIPVKFMRQIEDQIIRKAFSLKALAKKLKAWPQRFPSHRSEFANVNTPEDLATVRQLMADKREQTPLGRS